MDSGVDMASGQCFFQLLDEQAFAADVGERAVLDPIACGLDGHDLRARLRFIGAPAMGARESRDNHMRLRESERRTAGADAQTSLHA
jgi:hypothetical protein